MSASPDELRELALYTIEKCIHGQKLGGYTTKYIEDTIDWITAPETVFPGNLDLPPEITFFTAMVRRRRATASEEEYEPGAHDPQVSLIIRDSLMVAEEEALPYSELEEDLRKRYDYLAVSHRVQEQREWKRAWWESWIHPPSLTPNATLSTVVNVQ